MGVRAALQAGQKCLRGVSWGALQQPREMNTFQGRKEWQLNGSFTSGLGQINISQRENISLSVGAGQFLCQNDPPFSPAWLCWELWEGFKSLLSQAWTLQEGSEDLSAVPVLQIWSPAFEAAAIPHPQLCQACRLWKNNCAVWLPQPALWLVAMLWARMALEEGAVLLGLCSQGWCCLGAPLPFLLWSSTSLVTPSPPLTFTQSENLLSDCCCVFPDKAGLL